MAERAQGVPKVCPTYLVHAPPMYPPTVPNPTRAQGVHRVVMIRPPRQVAP